jgi:hypothetical protein
MIPFDSSGAFRALELEATNYVVSPFAAPQHQYRLRGWRSRLPRNTPTAAGIRLRQVLPMTN